MTLHPIHNLPPAELRGYARGLRETAALLATTWARVGEADECTISQVITLTRETWEREADLVEGFAARLEGAAPASDQPRPVTRERVAAWVQRFEAAARRTVAHPASAAPICTAADAECLPGCTMPQDGACGRGAPAATLPTQHRWYRFPDQDDRCKSLAELLRDMPTLEPYAVESSEWPGTRYACLAPNDEGTHDAILSETLEEANAYLADLPSAEPDTTLTPEETAQAGLADAVAEGAATGRPPATWTEERDALLALLYPSIICQDALFGLLSALPGEPIASVQAVRQRAAGRGIVRQGLPLPEGYEDQPVTDRSPRGMPGALKALAQPAERPMRSDSPWTKERLALMARLIPTAMHMDDVHKHVSALPGLPIASAETLRVKAGKIGLVRQGWPIPDEFLGAAESRSRVPQMAEKPPAAPIVKAAPMGMLPEDQAEAREGLRTGRFRGAKDIMEEYGCTQDEAQALVDEHRNRKPRAA